jgi:allene oxide cyclase-like protein
MLKRFTAIATAAALAALIVGAVSAASSSSRGSDGRDFTALDTTVKETDIDVDNSNSFTIGDEFIEHDVLKNRAGTKTIGSLDAICTFTDVSDENQTVHCVATVKLRGGTLEVAGLLNFSEETGHVAITGGTSRYDDAHGQLSLRAVSETDVLIRFDID